MASQAAINQFIEAANVIVEANIEGLIENPKWGTVNFKDVEPELRLAKQFIERVYDAPLLDLPESMVSSLIDPTKGLRNGINAILGFSVAQDNAGRSRSHIAGRIRSSSNQLLNDNSHLIGFLNFIEEEPEPNESEFAQMMDKANHQMSKFKEEMSGLADNIKANAVESDKALQATKETAGRAGLGVFTKDFDDAATRYNNQAEVWLRVASLLALNTLAVALLYGVLPSPDTEKWVTLIQYMTTKIVVIGLLITATVWCGKMYNTAKHHHTINKHRANAIATFQAFVEASNDPSVKDAVLMETTRSIFAIPPTGYVGGNSVGKDSNTVIEVMKNASTKVGE